MLHLGKCPIHLIYLANSNRLKFHDSRILKNCTKRLFTSTHLYTKTSAPSYQKNLFHMWLFIFPTERN